jgi:hypothetical protein
MVAYSFKRRFVDRIRVGLSSVSLSFDPPPKLQTIRAIGKRRHARPGEVLQLYTAMRTRQCAKIGDARCVAVTDIRIIFGDSSTYDFIYIGDCEAIHDIEQLDCFAVLDGFSCWDDMLQFWSEEHPDVRDFLGVLIQWEPL